MSSKPISVEGFHNGDYIVYQDGNGEYVMYHMSDDKLWRTSAYELADMDPKKCQQVEGIYQSDGVGKVIMSGHETIEAKDSLGVLKQIEVPEPEIDDEIGSMDVPASPGFEDDISADDLPPEPPAEPPVDLGEEEPTEAVPEQADELPPPPPAV